MPADRREQLVDEDDLEEFEPVGPGTKSLPEEINKAKWEVRVAHTTWDDEDKDDLFCQRLDAELQRCANTMASTM